MNGSADEPLVSVVILNYKRHAAFLRSVASVRSQSYPRIEIIVVDNYSQDDTCEWLTAHAPEVRLIELSENRGACGGRNAGIRAARGEIIITLDNDVFFESTSEVSKTVATFIERPDIHVLAYQLCDEFTGALRIREWCHPRSATIYGETEFESNYFVEGACAMRRQVYDCVGFYYEPLFYGTEGWDLAVRLLDRRFRILHTPHIRARHAMSQETRTADRPYHFWTRNYIIIAFKDYPFTHRVSFLSFKLLMMLYFAIRAGQLKAFCRGLKDGVAGIAQAKRDRTIIHPTTIAYLRELERWRPSLRTRFNRHREVIQL